jgi:hypothetical protein
LLNAGSELGLDIVGGRHRRVGPRHRPGRIRIGRRAGGLRLGFVLRHLPFGALRQPQRLALLPEIIGGARRFAAGQEIVGGDAAGVRAIEFRQQRAARVSCNRRKATGARAETEAVKSDRRQNLRVGGLRIESHGSNARALSFVAAPARPERTSRVRF